LGNANLYIQSMLLAIDIGNTNTVLAIYDKERLAEHHRFDTSPAMATEELKLHFDMILKKASCDSSQISDCIIASVVPPINSIYIEDIKKQFNLSPLFVSHETKLPIKIGYHDPPALGADRIANAVAGFVKYGGPIIVVDYGTATKFEVVTDTGLYVGGVIAPGAELSANALSEKAARLPRITLEKPDRAIGRNTVGAMQSGIFWGTIGQVDRIIKSIFDELGGQIRVVATGGLAGLYAPYSQHIEAHYPFLTLDGLRIIADYQPCKSS
jgi:type III pantothenate kinase